MDARVGSELEIEKSTVSAAVDLAYVSDCDPGLRRRKTRAGFSYEDGNRRKVRGGATLERIRTLAIPPAWTDVWICAAPNGHLQATGRDARGRKQYIYHARWREERERAKYEHMLEFASKLPRIRAQLRRDMRRRGTPREKVLAAIVHLLDTTLIRVGNKDYAEQNRSFGLTTLRDRHAIIDGADLRFEFKGKSGRAWRLRLHDRRITRIVKDCQDISGQHLFQYFDENSERRPVTSSDVNSYLREISGADVTAKDFRTWAGSVLAAETLSGLETFKSDSEAKKNVGEAIAKVAARLGNTAAVCRKCYVHPEIIECYLEGNLAMEMRREAASRKSPRGSLDPMERAVLLLLRRRLKTPTSRGARTARGP